MYINLAVCWLTFCLPVFVTFSFKKWKGIGPRWHFWITKPQWRANLSSALTYFSFFFFKLCLVSRARNWPSWVRGADPKGSFLQMSVCSPQGCRCSRLSSFWDWNSNSQGGLLNLSILVALVQNCGWKMVRGRELAHSWDLSLEQSPCFKACSY